MMLKTLRLVFGKNTSKHKADDAIRQKLDAAVRDNARAVAELSRVINEGPQLKLIAVPRRDNGRFAARPN